KLAPRPLGEDPIEPGARSAARSACAGMAIAIAAAMGPATPGFSLLLNLGSATATLSALVALARIPSLGGLLTAPPRARRLDAAAFSSLLWTVAVALPAA